MSEESGLQKHMISQQISEAFCTGMVPSVRGRKAVETAKDIFKGSGFETKPKIMKLRATCLGVTMLIDAEQLRGFYREFWGFCLKEASYYGTSTSNGT